MHQRGSVALNAIRGGSVADWLVSFFVPRGALIRGGGGPLRVGLFLRRFSFLFGDDDAPSFSSLDETEGRAALG